MADEAYRQPGLLALVGLGEGPEHVQVGAATQHIQTIVCTNAHTDSEHPNIHPSFDLFQCGLVKMVPV